MFQRWHEWRNMSDTACPSHGVVRVVTAVEPVPGIVDVDETLTDNEMLGASLILHGMRPNYDFEADDSYNNNLFRGLSIHYAFNGDTPVEPGQIGLLTFDLPTWAAIDTAPGGLSGGNGTFVTVFDDWNLINPPLVGDDGLLPHTGGIFVLASDPVNSRVFVGMGIVFTEDEEIL